MKKFIVSVFFCISSLQVMSIGPYFDVGRAAIIASCSSKAKKALESQVIVQELNATGHILLKNEVSEATNFQKEYKEYLELFGEVLSMTAEVYGIYYEVDKTIGHLTDLSKTLDNSPTNILAVALSTKRNKVYRQVAENGLDIVNDIRILFKSSSLMTQHERYKLLGKIRPKLHAMNRSLTVLNLAIKYTSLADVWHEITDRYNGEWCLSHKRKKAIALRSLRDWKSNVGMR